jgi:hypothetical protein
MVRDHLGTSVINLNYQEMKKTIVFVLIILSYSIPVYPLPGGKNARPVLKFNPDGKFKIVQFTDLHFRYKSYRSDSSLLLIKKVIRDEKPDLAVFTGDIIVSKDTRLAWIALSEAMTSTCVPWAVTFGNHDTEHELTGSQIIELLSGMPNNLTRNGPGDISGNGNYIIEIEAARSSRPAAALWFFDSHGPFPYGQKNKWDYIKHDQIEWYRKQSVRMTEKNNGNPLPALAFFHIPLPEYREIKNTAIGINRETITPAEINSGLFSAMFESGDVMGVFTGHNHNNNFIGCLYNICLAFGNVSGRESYGNIGRGARIIELSEGERKFSTWILNLYDCDREKDTWLPTGDRSPKFFVTYPDSFVNLKEQGDSYNQFINAGEGICSDYVSIIFSSSSRDFPFVSTSAKR